MNESLAEVDGMKPAHTIFVAGHRGLVGSALVDTLRAAGFDNLLLRTRAELDLTDAEAVRAFFEEYRPDHVFLAAAKVGGIGANSAYPADFVYQNLAIQTNVIHEAMRVGVRRLLFLGSSCIYPRDCPQPIRENYLLTGPLELTNRPYAVAKIAGIEMCWAYNRQYGTRYLSVMPTNLYGPGDNFDLQNSHVLPALIRKAHEAKRSGADSMIAWGTGRVRREFLFSRDMAEACVHLMDLPDAEFDAILTSDAEPPLVNIGCGEDVTIRELVELVCDVVGFRGEVKWDDSWPDGTPRKLLDVSRVRATGWAPRVGIRDGIERVYQWYLAQVGDFESDGAVSATAPTLDRNSGLKHHSGN